MVRTGDSTLQRDGCGLGGGEGGGEGCGCDVGVLGEGEMRGRWKGRGDIEEGRREIESREEGRR